MKFKQLTVRVVRVELFKQLMPANRSLNSQICWGCLAIALAVLLPADTASAYFQSANQQTTSEPATIQGAGLETQNSPYQPQTAEQSDEIPFEAAGNENVKPEVVAFRELLDKIRRKQTEVNQLYSSMPIGFPAKQQTQLATIKKLKSEIEAHEAERPQAALESFLAAPNQDPRASQIVYNTVASKLDGSNDTSFDPRGALELSMTMLSNELDIPQVAYQAFRASYALHDFERADRMLAKVEASGTVLKPEIRAKLEDTQFKWQREQTIRNLEQNTDDLPRVLFETTAGNFTVELYENHAPQTVGNFISLVEKKFYNDLIFHLVRPGQFSQCGCPDGNGSGNAGYQIPCETELPEIRHHFAGTISMAHNGKDTGGSQFFISHQPNLAFDGNYTAFGRVVDGLDVVFGIKKIDRTKGSEVGKKPVTITRATVLRKRDHSYSPNRIAKNSDNLHE